MSSLLSVAVTNTMTRAIWTGKGLFQPNNLQTLVKESQGKNLQAGAEAGTVDAPHVSLPALLGNLVPLAEIWHHPLWAGPSYINY